MWDLTGKTITGQYHGQNYSGTISSTRVCYGGDIQYTVELDQKLDIYGDIRDRILVRKEKDSGQYQIGA
jgi:hypothetical protein